MDKDELEEDQEEEEELATPEEMKAEAVERMKLLKIYPETIRQFENEGLVSIAEPPIGAHYWANEELQGVIQDIENEFNILVYYGILSYIEDVGPVYDLFYVINDPNEWPLDRYDMEGDQTITYCYVVNRPEDSEIGPIGYTQTPAGGLRRTW